MWPSNRTLMFWQRRLPAKILFPATLSLLAFLSAAMLLAAEPKLLTLQPCMVSILDEVALPAQEPGVLVSLQVREGDRVAKGTVLGRIDDTERVLQREVASFEQQSSAAQAESEISIQYSIAATAVAEAEYLAAIEANKKVAGTFPVTEIRRLKLAWQKAALEINQAELDRRVAGLTSRAKESEVRLADANITRRQLVCPIDGLIVERHKHPGEWVHAGDDVLRVVRLDVLRVEGFVKAESHDPSELLDCPVRVTVALAKGRTAEFRGAISYVHPSIETGNLYRVWAEVQNRQEKEQWLLLPGHMATMTILLDPQPAAGGQPAIAPEPTAPAVRP